MRAPVGRHITASLDAQTPGVRTTRLLRPRTANPEASGAGVCSPPMSSLAAVTAPCRTASRATHGCPPCRHAIAPALPRPPHPGPHLVTIAKRPFGRAGMRSVCHKSEIRKSKIFLPAGVDGGFAVLPNASLSSRHAAIASAAKQSRVFPRRDSGLLRCARNDEEGAAGALTSLRAGVKRYRHTRASFSARSPSTPLINPTDA